MKHVKKLIGLLLALVMALPVSVTVLAEDETPKYEYELYQIFTGDYAGGVLSNVKWGTNGTETPGKPVDEETLDELTGVNNRSDSQKLDVITKYVNWKTAPVTTQPTTDQNGNVTYTGLATGYYLVKDKTGSVTGNDVYTTYVVQVTDGTLTFERKGDVPEVEKKIVEGELEVDTNEASIGDTITFQITGTLPDNFEDYKEYTYLFTDTLSKGLTYNENPVTVKVVNGSTESDITDVTQYFYIGAATDPATGETTLKVGMSDLKALNNLENVTVNANSKIVVTYTATLNENAVIAGAGNENKVKLSYSNDPNNSGDGTKNPPPENPGEPTEPAGETPEQKTTTYTTELTILKNDGEGKILTGAEFTLTGAGVNIAVITGDVYVVKEDGEYWKLKDGTYTKTAPTIGGDSDNQNSYDNVSTKYAKETRATVAGKGTTEKSVSAYVNSEGEVTFSGLGAGTYIITETKTPAGYNTIAPITFTITFDAGTQKFATNNENIKVGEDNMLDTTIVNQSGSTLPSTGGMGTTIFYILGAILVVGAGILLIVRRRMNTKK